MAEAGRTRASAQLSLDVGGVDAEGYRGPTVCDIVGISYRQLDYWARTRLVEPSLRKAEGSGTPRLYSFEDVLRVKVVKSLLDAGVSLQKVRIALDELRARDLSVTAVTLASDGSSVYALDDDRQVLDLLRSGQGVFALAIEPLVEELRGEVVAFPSERLDGTEATTEPVRAVARA